MIQKQPLSSAEKRTLWGIFGGVSVAGIGAAAVFGHTFLQSLQAPPKVDLLIHTLGQPVVKEGAVKTDEQITFETLQNAKRELVAAGPAVLPDLLEVLATQKEYPMFSVPSMRSINHDLRESGKGDTARGLQNRISDVEKYLAGDQNALAPKWRGIEHTLDVVGKILKEHPESREPIVQTKLLEMWNSQSPHMWRKSTQTYWLTLADTLYSSGDRTHISEFLEEFFHRSNRFEMNRYDVCKEIEYRRNEDPSISFASLPNGETYKKEIHAEIVALARKEREHGLNSKESHSLQYPIHLYHSLATKPEFEALRAELILIVSEKEESAVKRRLKRY